MATDTRAKIIRAHLKVRRAIVGGLLAAAALVVILGGYGIRNDVRWALWLAVTVAVVAMLTAAWRIDRSMRRRMRAELDLEESRRFLHTIFETTPDVVYVFDLVERRYTYLNRSITAALGYTPEAVVAMGDRLISTIVHPEDGKQFEHLRSSSRSMGGTPIEAEFRVQHADGSWRWMRAREVVFKRDINNDPVQLVGIAGDITERRSMEQALADANQRLEELAATDPMTGLANRRVLRDRLELEIQRLRRTAEPLALILMDVDHFKSFNDTFGHPEGDRVLIQVAKVLQSEVRPTDLVARFGGEEFAIVLAGSDAAASLATAERLRIAIERTPWRRRPITASFGVSCAGAGSTPESLVKSADVALYQSKESGRNRVTLSGQPLSRPQADLG